MSTFLSIGYSPGQNILARGIASNSLGLSATESLDPVTTVKVQTTPQVPQNPILTIIDQNRL